MVMVHIVIIIVSVNIVVGKNIIGIITHRRTLVLSAVIINA